MPPPLRSSSARKTALALVRAQRAVVRHHSSSMKLDAVALDRAGDDRGGPSPRGGQSGVRSAVVVVAVDLGRPSQPKARELGRRAARGRARPRRCRGPGSRWRRRSAVRLARRRWPASASASQTEPSFSSPSPTRQKVRRPLPSSRSASAQADGDREAVAERAAGHLDARARRAPDGRRSGRRRGSSRATTSSRVEHPGARPATA